MVTKAQILDFLNEVPDPEIPVLTLADLGIIRNVDVKDDAAVITITPTYTGCPAMRVIEEDISAKLLEKGITDFTIKTALAPAWTTDWMSEEGKRKLKEYGIAPPEKRVSAKKASGAPANVACPRCGSSNTQMKSYFGSTPCKSLYVCNECKEPFDYFKCL